MRQEFDQKLEFAVKGASQVAPQLECSDTHALIASQCLQRHSGTAGRLAAMLVSSSSLLLRLESAAASQPEEKTVYDELRREMELLVAFTHSMLHITSHASRTPSEVLEATRQSTELQRKTTDELMIGQAMFDQEDASALVQDLASKYEEVL